MYDIDLLRRDMEAIERRIADRQLYMALTLVHQLINSYPDAPQAWLLYSRIAAGIGEIDKALNGYQHACELAPEDGDARLARLQLLVRAGRHREALEEALLVAKFEALTVEQQDALGAVLAFCGEPIRALSLFESACRQRPDQADYLFNLASAQRMNGLLDAAEATLDRVIEIRPDDARAYAMRSDLRTQTVSRNHVTAITAAITANAGGSAGATLLHYAVAKELEDLGRFPESFAYLKRGADMHRASIRYDATHDLAVLQRLIERHNQSVLTGPSPGYLTDEPIFVLGLPRSGTTLVEQMLGSHPEVFAAGELQAFSVVVTQLAQRRGGTIRSQRDLVDRSLDIDPVELGAKYLEATRPRTGHTARFVDKMPMNYLNVLLIHRALPKARIVAVRRNPVDSCYAMYKSFLTGPYRFTNDLGDIARYYAAWCRLMDHWDSLLGSALLRVRYEDVVTDTERVARRLLDYCGLPWSRRCLAFHESAAAVATASASQVRRPIYASSIGKWRAYRTELQPLLSALRAEGIVIED